ncbi:hypothetical protein POM88_010075 [Heracleum sosnowskyi]|uniref:Uncharacterized protein n=1 Tax=Heracleum sosnowskyi TaxID=360622 RepID=A0AAD8JD26_9APIA|nr:hypothetical protein POM88_010075 [Heracleum sosnowskyi]
MIVAVRVAVKPPSSSSILKKIPSGLRKNSNESIQCSKFGVAPTNSSGSSKSVQQSNGSSAYVPSGCSSRALFMTSASSGGNSRGSSDFNDDDIPYYKSFDGSSMVVSDPQHGIGKVSEIHNPIELMKGMMFDSKG